MVLQMNKLQQLKKGLLKGKNRKFLNLSANMVKVMEVVGGYPNLMKLPLSSYFEILNALEHIAKEENKSLKK